MGVYFEFLREPILSKLAEGTYELGGAGAIELLKSIRVLLSSSASAAVFSTEEMNDGDNTCIQSSQSRNFGFDWNSSDGGVEAKGNFVDGGICVMMKNDQIFVEALG